MNLFLTRKKKWLHCKKIYVNNYYSYDNINNKYVKKTNKNCFNNFLYYFIGNNYNFNEEINNLCFWK